MSQKINWIDPCWCGKKHDKIGSRIWIGADFHSRPVNSLANWKLPSLSKQILSKQFFFAIKIKCFCIVLSVLLKSVAIFTSGRIRQWTQKIGPKTCAKTPVDFYACANGKLWLPHFSDKNISPFFPFSNNVDQFFARSFFERTFSRLWFWNENDRLQNRQSCWNLNLNKNFNQDVA